MTQGLSDIMPLCILPLEDGTWTSASSKRPTSSLIQRQWAFYGSLICDFSLQISNPIPCAIFCSRSRVKRADPQVIATKILELHRRGSHLQSENRSYNKLVSIHPSILCGCSTSNGSACLSIKKKTLWREQQSSTAIS